MMSEGQPVEVVPARPLNDLRVSGLLWLINRTVFHPRGFAIRLHYSENDEVTGWSLIGDGIEPMNFEDGTENNYLAAVNLTLAPKEDKS